MPRKSAPAAPPGTRSRILTAACDEFGAKGFAATTVDRIARRARVNTALAHFTSGGPLIMFRATAPVRERIKLTQRIDIPDVESAALVAHLQMVARRMLAPARIEDHI